MTKEGVLFLAKKHIAIYLTGGIALYKAASCVREFVKHGYEVRCVMTENALKFVSKLTFETLSQNPVLTDLFDRNNQNSVAHIELADWTDIALVVPATADIIAKMALGIADNAVSTSLLATAKPKYVVPAMNDKMWDNPATKRNLDLLKQDGVQVLEPEVGFLAEGYQAKGRMPEPKAIYAWITAKSSPKPSLKDKKIIVTAGGTVEEIDPVRFLGNHSTGKMGYALAAYASACGASVTLVHGPTNLHDLPGVEMVSVTSAREMFAAVKARFETADAVIMAAAVADYRPEIKADQKIKKVSGPWQLTLVRNPDILQELGQLKTHQKLVGFAAETQNLFENAPKKLQKKNLDLLAANDVSKKDIGFGSDENEVYLYFKDGKMLPLKKDSKQKIAQEIVDQLALLLKGE